MRGKARQSENNEEQYRASNFLKSSSNKRLDLNDLLKRVEDQKKSDKKINILIYSGAVSAITIFVLFISL